jgi:hypothetical protein
VIEGEYGTTVGETGLEEPVLSTVLSKHAEGDLDPVRELPYRLAAHIAALRSRTDGSIRLRANAHQKSLASTGASTDGKRTFGASSPPETVLK